MLRVPLFIELLRTRPRLVFWSAALAQAALWLIVPAVFYWGPPGQLPETLAIGHEFQLGSHEGPPLAFWIGEIAFRIGGLPGVYLLSQACILTAYWAVFALGRDIVGERHAVLAVLLMVGVSAFTVPTPDFGPAVLAIPLWALALLHFWRALGQGERIYWFPLGLELGLLALTTYSGLLLVALLVLFMLLTKRGWASLLSIEPWIAGVIAVLVFFPHLIWIEQAGGASLVRPGTVDDSLRAWFRLLLALIVAHAGLCTLAILGRGFGTSSHTLAPEVVRAPVDPVARMFVNYFALAPAAASVVLVFFARGTESFAAGPLALMSGLAVILAAGDRIRIVYQRLASMAWAGLLLLPPLIVALAVTFLPFAFGIDLRVAQPTGRIGAHFAEAFERRTGRPLRVVTGEPRVAALIAMSAPSRPRVFDYANPQRTPWIGERDIEQNGALVAWQSTATLSAPPEAIHARFRGIVPEVPHGFQRRLQGRLPLFRVGWSVIRPRAGVGQ